MVTENVSSNLMGHMKLINYCFKISILCLVSITLNVNAQSFMPSPQQIQQFKNLPRAQQEQLARQMGFDMSILDSINSNGQSESNRDQIDFVEREVDNKEISNQLSKQSIVTQETKKLDPFGYDIFKGRDDAVQPSANVPVPSNYIMGPGDSVKLQLFGKETGEFELSVNNEGNIDLPDLGPLQVVGTSFQELKELVKEKYNQQKIGVSSFVSMGQVRTIQIFLVGEVFRPGPLVVSGLSTVTTALINSGGVNEIGSLRNIELKRAGKTVAQFDLYDLIVKGDTSNDIRLEQGDVLFVPTAKVIVSIDGKVRRPAIYELVANETIGDLIELAGGLLPKADSNSLQLVRKNQQTGLSISNINANKSGHLNLPLSNGDFLRIPETNLEFNNAIIINGAINMPNIIADNGLELSDVVTEQTIYSNTDLYYALLVRKERFSEQSTVIQFKPIDVITGQFNEPLKAFDELIFFSRVVRDLATGVEKDVVEGNLQTSQDDIRSEQATYFQEVEANRFTSNSFARESNRNYSRKELLSPLIVRLKSEASERQPVQLYEINGEVRYPGVYPKPTVNSLSNALTAAGGLTESAHLESAEITSVNILNGILQVEHKRVNLISQLLLPETQQVKLQSKDVLSVVRIPQWYESNNIVLKGEITFPGTYQIKNGETLASVIKRAGGLADGASVYASVFTREELKEKERANIDKTIEDLRQQLANNSLSTSQFTKTVDYETANQILDDLTSIKPIGRMVIDVESIIDGKKGADIIVKNGDELVVPNITPAVSVIGEVFVATTHRYDPSLSVYDYIELAGGIREYGDDTNIYIVRANGSVFIPENDFWFANNNKASLAPGDTIVVPRDVTNYENLSVWQGVTQILYQTAVALAALRTL
jgi:protein involved in polysaccharide export with SLBB domain